MEAHSVLCEVGTESIHNYTNLVFTEVIPWLGRLVVGLFLYGLRIDAGQVHVSFVVDSGNVTDFSPSILFFSCQYHSANATYLPSS